MPMAAEMPDSRTSPLESSTVLAGLAVSNSSAQSTLEKPSNAGLSCVLGYRLPHHLLQCFSTGSSWNTRMLQGPSAKAQQMTVSAEISSGGLLWRTCPCHLRVQRKCSGNSPDPCRPEAAHGCKTSCTFTTAEVSSNKAQYHRKIAVQAVHDRLSRMM